MIETIINYILHYMSVIFTTLIGLVTVTSSPVKTDLVLIHQIEADIKIDLPDTAQIQKKYEDWFGFDLTQKYEISFAASNRKHVVNQLNNQVATSNQGWSKENRSYYFTDESNDNYFIKAKYVPKQNILYYEFFQI